MVGPPTMSYSSSSSSRDDYWSSGEEYPEYPEYAVDHHHDYRHPPPPPPRPRPRPSRRRDHDRRRRRRKEEEEEEDRDAYIRDYIRSDPYYRRHNGGGGAVVDRLDSTGEFGGYGGGHEKECCPLVVKPLVLVALLGSLAAATAFLNVLITMNIGRRRRRRRSLQEEEHLPLHGTWLGM